MIPTSIYSGIPLFWTPHSLLLCTVEMGGADCIVVAGIYGYVNKPRPQTWFSVYCGHKFLRTVVVHGAGWGIVPEHSKANVMRSSVHVWSLKFMGL